MAFLIDPSARRLLASINASTPVARRDRAVLALLAYTAARASEEVLLSNHKVPEHTSHFNATRQGGFGAYWFLRPRSAVMFGVRYHHISNASTAERNPGYNAIYIYSGFSWWR